MRLRLTPLNFVSAGLAVSVISAIFQRNSSAVQISWGWLALLLVLSSISDIFFRSMLRVTKRIWLIECIFIIFVVALLLLIGKISL